MKSAQLVKSDSWALSLVLITAFAMAMVASAYIKIPLFFTPVPLTLQTLVLFVSIAVLNKKAPFVQVLYLALAVVGFPVFTNAGAGLFYLMGPTGGYIVGFLMVALFFGFTINKVRSFFGYILFFTLASLVIYLFGLIWLIGLHHMMPKAAFGAGVLPFIPGDALKIVLASSIAFLLQRQKI